MGLAFYGRAFAASSSSCLELGCTYQSGALPGKCSQEISILLNLEIDEIVTEKGIRPRLYEDAAVKVATWDD
jgi:chitinase